MKETDQLILNKFHELPAELQRALTSIPWKKSVQGIGASLNLSSGQVSSLETETMLVLYGFENSDSYLANIVNSLSIDEGTASKIGESMIEKVFMPIAEAVENKDSNEIAGPNLPEVAPEIHPMVEEGETAHDVPLPEERDDAPEPAHTAPAPVNLPTSEPASSSPSMPEQKVENVPAPEPKGEEIPAPAPKSSYPGGQDPYREPIE